MEKIDLYWVQDSFGRDTCHINEPNLTYNNSLIGEIYRKELKEGASWTAVLKDGTSLGEFPTLNRARTGLEEHYRKRNK